jgi:hypothetical protein
MKRIALVGLLVAALFLGLFAGGKAEACPQVAGVGIGHAYRLAGFGHGYAGHYGTRVTFAALPAYPQEIRVQLPAAAAPRVDAVLPADPGYDPCQCNQVQLGVPSSTTYGYAGGYSAGAGSYGLAGLPVLIGVDLGRYRHNGFGFGHHGGNGHGHNAGVGVNFRAGFGGRR